MQYIKHQLLHAADIAMDNTEELSPYAIDNVWIFDGHAYTGPTTGPVFEQAISEIYGLDFRTFWHTANTFCNVFLHFPSTDSMSASPLQIHHFLTHASFFHTFCTATLCKTNVEAFCRFIRDVKANADRFKKHAEYKDHTSNPFYKNTYLSLLSEFLDHPQIVSCFLRNFTGLAPAIDSIVHDAVASSVSSQSVLNIVFYQLQNYLQQLEPATDPRDQILVSDMQHFAHHMKKPLKTLEKLSDETYKQQKPREDEKTFALAMAFHKRLGSRSQLRHMPTEVFRHIADESHYRGRS